jgi:hypothetical protein
VLHVKNVSSGAEVEMRLLEFFTARGLDEIRWYLEDYANKDSLNTSRAQIWQFQLPTFAQTLLPHLQLHKLMEEDDFRKPLRIVIQGPIASTSKTLGMKGTILPIF